MSGPNAEYGPRTKGSGADAVGYTNWGLQLLQSKGTVDTDNKIRDPAGLQEKRHMRTCGTTSPKTYSSGTRNLAGLHMQIEAFAARSARLDPWGSFVTFCPLSRALMVVYPKK